MEAFHDMEEQTQLVHLPASQDLGLFSRDPETAFQQAEALVRVVSRRCSGPAYIANIKGRQYPKIEWWTTVSASLGLFPQVVHAKRLERESEIAYEARVEVRHNGQVIASGEAMCSDRESRWHSADEYAIKSMAITRASGKAYRIPLSFLAVMAGLEATPAEEMPFDIITPGEVSVDDFHLTRTQRSCTNDPVSKSEGYTRRESSESTATQKQVNRILGILNDERVTQEEIDRVQTLMRAGLSRKKAGEVLDYFLGRSELQNGEWNRIGIGVLEAR